MVDRRQWLIGGCGGIGAWLLGSDSTRGGQWLQWRGPSRDGTIPPQDWPDRLSDGRIRSLWQVPLQPSYSGPIVTDERVMVTETRDKAFEVVTAFDRQSGKRLWKTEWPGAMEVPFFAAANGSWIRSTPACDLEHLYVGGMRDVVVCLRVEDGREVWRRDFVGEGISQLPAFGLASSPLVDGESLYIQAGGGVTRLDKGSGRTVWTVLKDSGGMSGGAFSSPVIAELSGVRQLVVQTRTALAGIDLESGQVLWQQPVTAFRGMNILTPTIIGDSVFTSSYGGKSEAYAIERNGDAWNVRRKWQHKSQGYMSSPVVVDGAIYLHLRNQRVVCLDAETGHEYWTSTPFGKYWSMVANAGRILALDEGGELLLLEASTEKPTIIDRLEVGTDTWAHLAVVDDLVFVRDLLALKVFQWD
ncbi:MAG: hypothetical protein KatS3mg111_1670 [Pirellulaceae bacterium]|nr:MAG: hypothetical protein KatS3mg111_1670 [Pirellulaceae bacterium]